MTCDIPTSPDVCRTAPIALVVMARCPAGTPLKTRLAATVGPDQAREIYLRLLNGTLAAAEKAAATLGTQTAPHIERPLTSRTASHAATRNDDRATWSADDRSSALILAVAGAGIEQMAFPGWEIVLQRGDDLGRRLAGVFTELFARGHAIVIVMGSDSPGLPATYVAESVARLEADGDAVVGPAADGGFYLLGFSRSAWNDRATGLCTLLGSLPMSTARTRDHLVWGLQEFGQTVDILPLWVDVDEVADLPVAARLTMDAPARGGAEPTLRSVYLHITHRCDGGCPHCYDRDSNSDIGGELSPAAWADIVSQAAAMGTTRFEIIGGDPFVRHDLLDLIRAITTVYGSRVRVFFNRELDGTEVAALVEAGNGLLTPLVSLDGTQSSNDRLRGPGNFAAVSATIRRLVEAGLRPVVNTVLVRPVLAELHRLPSELQDMGATQLHLILPHARGGLARRPDMVPSGAELRSALERLLPAAAASGVAVDNLSAWTNRLGSPRDLCNAGCSMLTVGPTGLVYACPITCGDPAFIAGDTRTARLAAIWRDSPALALVRSTSARDRVACASCDVVDACGGECWVQAHYAARAESEPAGPAAPFPYCDLVRPIFVDLLAAERGGAARGTDVIDGGSATTSIGRVARLRTADLTPFECI